MAPLTRHPCASILLLSAADVPEFNLESTGSHILPTSDMGSFGSCERASATERRKLTMRDRMADLDQASEWCAVAGEGQVPVDTLIRHGDPEDRIVDVTPSITTPLHA